MINRELREAVERAMEQRGDITITVVQVVDEAAPRVLATRQWRTVCAGCGEQLPEGRPGPGDLL